MSDIKSKPATNSYRDGWDRVFNKNKNKIVRKRRIFNVNKIKKRLELAKNFKKNTGNTWLSLYKSDIDELLKIVDYFEENWEGKDG